MNRIVCLGKRIIGNCVKDKIEKYENNIDIFQKEIDSCIKQNNINEVLKFSNKYIRQDFDYFEVITVDEIEEITEKNNKYKKEYGSQSEKCKCNCNIKKNKEKITNKINKYNRDLQVIRNVQKHYIKYNKKSNSDTYLKFGLDREKNLIVMHFDIDAFIEKTIRCEHVQVFSAEGITTTLFLRQEFLGSDLIKDRGVCAYIREFISKKQKCGQGTFILENLENLMKNINAKLRSIEGYDKDCDFFKAITGEIIPGYGITKRKLISFYKKNGFEILRRGKHSSVLFKKIE